MSWKNATILEGVELKTPRDYRIAAAAVGYEAYVTTTCAANPGYTDGYAHRLQNEAVGLAIRAAHYANRAAAIAEADREYRRWRREFRREEGVRA